jgi:hypothetical protein
VTKALKLRKANASRWTGRALNIERDNELCVFLRNALSKFRTKRREKSEPDEYKFYRKDPLEADADTKVPVTLKDLVQDDDAQSDSFESEAVFRKSMLITLFLQRISGVTADQKVLALAMLLKSQSSPTIIVVKEPKFPNKLNPRVEVTRSTSALFKGAKLFRSILITELEERILNPAKVPPASVLVLLMLSKQGRNPIALLPAYWQYAGTRALNKAIRDARAVVADLKPMARSPTRSPLRKKKRFSASLCEDSDESEDDVAPGLLEKDSMEIDRWNTMPSSTVKIHTFDGAVDHLALVSAVKAEHPVIYVAYQMHASAGSTSSNTESHFSHATGLQDDHKSMGVEWMQTLCLL